MRRGRRRRLHDQDADIKGYLERVGYWMGRRRLTPAERQAVPKMVVSRLPPRASAVDASASVTARAAEGLDAQAILQMAGFVAKAWALLVKTQLLSPIEIEASIGRWHTMYRIPVFSDACRRDEEDYGLRLQGNADAKPSPLGTLLSTG